MFHLRNVDVENRIRLITKIHYDVVRYVRVIASHYRVQGSITGTLLSQYNYFTLCYRVCVVSQIESSLI